MKTRIIKVLTFRHTRRIRWLLSREQKEKWREQHLYQDGEMPNIMDSISGKAKDSEYILKDY